MTELNALISGINQQSIGQCWIGSGYMDESSIIDLAMRTYCPSKCGACQNCLSWYEGEHPDFQWVRPIEGHSIKIDAIRLACERTLKQPVRSHHLVIISSAHTLTEASYHCLLKTLEESHHAWFLLVTPFIHMLPQTIKSRCQTFVLPETSNAIDYHDWKNSLVSSMFDLNKAWTDKKYNVDNIVANLLEWIYMQYAAGPDKSIWLDGFDDVILWHAEYKSKSNLSDVLMLEKLSGLTSRLYESQKNK